MDTFFFALAFIFIIGFWLWDGLKLLSFWGVVEGAKSWSSKEAELIGLASSELVKNPGKRGFLSRFFGLLFSKRTYNFFAKFDAEGVEVGVFNLSLYPSYNRHITFFCRSLERTKPKTINVFYNPDAPHEVTVIPPGEHKIVRRCVWFGTKTFALTLILLYLFV